MSDAVASPVPKSVCRRRPSGVAALVAVALSIGFSAAVPLHAASTTATGFFTPQGSDAGTANGDYISDAGGLDTFYRYFIEVPPGLGRLTVELFDPDIGEGGGGEDTAGRDRDRDDGYDTQVTYTLLRPDGSTAATFTNCDDNDTECDDNVWNTLLNSTTAQNTAAGHWELRVDMNGANDINAFGIRAHDGNNGAGGTELNVYYDSHAQFGVNPSAAGDGANSRSYTMYPYLTSGCSAAKNDFDFDRNSGDTGAMTFTSRNGTFIQTYDTAATAQLSNNNAWRRDTFSGWTSDQLSLGYGIWTAALTISTYFTPGVNGNYANLYFTNFQAAANPPGTNPTANTFRVYLPNDAGAAPVKPYVEQQLTHAGCAVNGPNPPVVGQTSCYTITVRVVNPAAQSITFSAANLVTANVPAGVAYNGIAQISQGSIVSQPAVGGTGNITWNPGTVTAGSTELLAYTVRVTPTLAGQRIPVTATPASGNGTRARYVDTTGNTTQARATYEFGPLCELAVTQGLLTHAVVSSVSAQRAQGGGVLLEWQTASEAGTAGFYVQRWDGAARRWVAVNKELLGGVQAAQGGTYRLVDTGAPRLPQLTYRIEEVEAGGRRRTYGPYALAVGDRPDPRTGGDAFEREAHPATRRAEAPESFPEIENRAAAAVSHAAPFANGATDGVHLAVRETGLYYLQVSELAAWLGLPAAQAGKLIAEGKLVLTRGGQAVAWYPDLVAGGLSAQSRTARGLFFYGEAPDSLYTEAAAYRLQANGTGLLMQAVAAGATAAVPGGSFTDTRHTERNAFPATLLAPDPESDYWFWEFLQGDDPTFGHHTFTLDAPGLAQTTPAAADGTLTVALQGATASGVDGEHRAAVALNGIPLGEAQWTGITPLKAVFAVPPGLLHEADNKVEVTAATGAGAPYSVTYVDAFDLSYPRIFRAAGDALAFTSGGQTRVTVNGFTSAAVRLLDVRLPTRPRWLTGALVQSEPGGFRLTLPAQAEGRYLAVAPTALKTLAAVRPWSAATLRSTSNRADYLVIAPAALRESAERLADLRRDQGLTAMVIDLDQIADEFNGGAPGPHGIRAFLAATRQWSRKPRYVALAGEGTLDYRNLLGYGDNLVPPLLVQSESGLFPSDNRLGDVDGDGVPEMAVGRIPVLSADELDAFTAKIAAYESAPGGDWTANTVLLADAPDGGADFAADSDRIAGQIQGRYARERIYLSELPFEAARGRLLAALGAPGRGAAFVNYMGHGALDRLSAGGLLTSADVPNLANGERLPVVTAMTCTVNRFALPGIPALGELLVKSETGGAIAVWGPSGLSTAGGARLLAERFYHAGEEAGPRLGDRILRAMAEFRAQGGDPLLARIYDLLGDPALRLQVPAEVGTSPEGTGE
jgi:Peptidase family C25